MLDRAITSCWPMATYGADGARRWPAAANRGSRSCCAQHGHSRRALHRSPSGSRRRCHAGRPRCVTTRPRVGGDRTSCRALPLRGHGTDRPQHLLRSRRDRGLLRVRRLPRARPVHRPERQGRCRSAQPHVHHNYFADFVGTAGDNAHEALQIGQIGQDALLRIGAIIEDNLFVDVSIDSETISVKSSGNIIRRNTFLDCRSRPTNRFGNDNLWHANWIENAAGCGSTGQTTNWLATGSSARATVHAHGRQHHAARKSVCARAERQGRRAWRPHCQDVTAIGNEADILVVGKVIKAFGEAFTLPAVGTRIAGHVGPDRARTARRTPGREAGSRRPVARAARLAVGRGWSREAVRLAVGHAIGYPFAAR